MDSIKRDKRNFFFAYNMIFDLPIDEHAKVVYLCLCRYADGENQSFPSQLTIGSRCGIKSRTTVKKAIDKLMETGLLDYITRTDDKTGGQSSNLYTIYNEPDEEVKKKYAQQHQDTKKEPDKPHPVDLPPCPADEHPPVHQMDTPPVQQMDTPCSPDGYPPVQQMNTPCPADGHEVYPVKNTHLRNTQSIYPDGRTEQPNILKDFGFDSIRHTGQLDYVKTALSDLLRTGRIGKSRVSPQEIQSALVNLTPEIVDSVLDRFLGQLAKESVPCPLEYLKSCFLSAGRDAALNKSAEGSAARDKPSFDVEKYTNLSMERLLEWEGK